MFKREIETSHLRGNLIRLLAHGLVMPHERSFGVSIGGDRYSRDAVLDDWARDGGNLVCEH